ncbi:MAG: glycosyltransferase family 4 protein [Flavobacteriales bacterium]|nr:glycosyltransferase family 4 protein [Flavobacteriales bacterium]
MKKKILVICPYPENVAAAQRLKYEQYFPAFRKAGYELDVEPFFNMAGYSSLYVKGKYLTKSFHTIIAYFRRFPLLFRIRKYDLVYNFLWVTPLGPPIFEFLIHKLSKRIIYDIDDMVFLGHASRYNKFSKLLKGKNKMIYMMKNADHVITCTPVLDQFVRKFNLNTTDISSTVDTEAYVQREEISWSDKPTIGWSGSHSTSKYLKLLENVFIRLKEEKGVDFRVLIIGDEEFKFDSERFEYKAMPWNLKTEVEDLRKIDIGVYPLLDEPWIYGKSGLKAIQYMAIGIPTIASEWGTIGRIIRSGENGLLVKSDDEWLNALLEIIRNVPLREQFRVKGRDTIVNKYSLLANEGTYLNIIADVIRKN